MVTLVPVVYTGRGKPGDFAWMIRRDEYRDVLFVFNDNEAEFYAQSGRRGKGNSVVRPYQKLNPPRSTGIPTGFYEPRRINRGYRSLEESKTAIDAALHRICELLATGRYKRVMYSATPTGELGTGLFQVASAVTRYIMRELVTIARMHDLTPEE